MRSGTRADTRSGVGCRRTSRRYISALTAAAVTRAVATRAGGKGPGCGDPRGAELQPRGGPDLAEARCRPPVTGAALALPRSPFSLVFAIRPNLLRQEVQMSPNCFHSDGVFSSEAVVQGNQTPRILFFYPFHLLSVSPPGNCVASPSSWLRFAAEKGTFFPFRSLLVN